jgi:eukaryotic-like serine/threonine-protein kinase
MPPPAPRIDPDPATLVLESGTVAIDSGAVVSSAFPSEQAARQMLGGRYEVVALLGAGGMGSVYRARDVELDEIVALKVLRRELVDHPGMLDRFRREVKLARRVTHRNVARTFDIGEHGSERFLTMEYVEGESLAALLAREGALPVARVVDLALGVCGGLAAAHAAGVVHRDLKPDNVLLGTDGRVVVTDFGIARACIDEGGGNQTQGMLLGTPAYMAPEQVDGSRDIDGRADIYALGALLYELFTGEQPWAGASPVAIAAARLVRPPPDPRVARPDLPTSCAELVLRCMARRPEDRFATVAEVAARLTDLTLPGLPSAPGPSTVHSPFGPSAALEAKQPTDKLVAVLPFRNAGPPEDAYLAEELTDDLIDTLSMTRGLKVRPRSVVAPYQHVQRDPREIGHELGVQVVVEGSVRKAPGRLRITARLVSVADGFQLWAKRFDRPESEALAVNDDAARAIAEALTVDPAAGAARAIPADPRAMDLYLRARNEYRKFWPDNLRVAIDLFEQASALAPSDPIVLAGLATARARLAFFTGEGVEAAKATAQQAVALAPALAETRLALALTLFQAGDCVGAIRELKEALRRNPSLAEAQAHLGRILVEIGHIEEGMRWMESAKALDPEVPLVTAELPRAYALLGRWDEADRLQAADAKASIGNTVARARLLSWHRDVAGAKALLAALGPNVHALPAVILDLVIKGDSGSWTFPPELFPSERSGAWRRLAFMDQITAEVHAVRGDPKAALTATTRSIDAGLIDLAWLERCPLLSELPRLPGYAAVHARLWQRAEGLYAAYCAP